MLQKARIKSIIEKLQNELQQLGKKQTKRCPNIKREQESKKCSKTFSKLLERQNVQNQIIYELYTDDNKSKYSSNPKNIFKSAKKFMKNLTLRRQLPNLLPLNFSAKFLTEKKYLMNNLTL